MSYSINILYKGTVYSYSLCSVTAHYWCTGCAQKHTNMETKKKQTGKCLLCILSEL